MEVIATGHSAYRLLYHVVWVCKYRRKVLNPGVCSHLRKVLTKLLQSMPGVVIEQIGFDKDHLHMVIIIPPKYSIASIMGELKGKSASRLRHKFSWLQKVYWKENVFWSPGYFVSSVGIDEATIRNYVKLQGARDSGQLKLNL